jgi:hypothetical protein
MFRLAFDVPELSKRGYVFQTSGFDQTLPKALRLPLLDMFFSQTLAPDRQVGKEFVQRAVDQLILNPLLDNRP